MAIRRRDFAQGTFLEAVGPYDLLLRARALCPDGKLRRTSRLAKTADSAFSIPAAIRVRGRTAAGYIYVETVSGFSVATDDDPAMVKFAPFDRCKHLFEKV